MSSTSNNPMRYPLGLPAGSVRSILMIMILGMICALVLLSNETTPIRIPPYLVYLLFLILGSFFATLSNKQHADETPPLFLPRGIIRFIILACLIATVAYKVANDLPGWNKQFEISVEAIKGQPLLPLIVVGGFLIGIIVRILTHPFQQSFAYQDILAWISLISLLLLTIDILIELVINPTLQPEHRLDLPNWQGFLAAVVAFYYGVRS